MNIADMLTCQLEHVLIVLIASSTLVTLLVSESMGTPGTGSGDHCLETSASIIHHDGVVIIMTSQTSIEMFRAVPCRYSVPCLNVLEFCLQ